MLTALSRYWTQITNSISYNNPHYAKQAFYFTVMQVKVGIQFENHYYFCLLFWEPNVYCEQTTKETSYLYS